MPQLLKNTNDDVLAQAEVARDEHDGVPLVLPLLESLLGDFGHSDGHCGEEVDARRCLALRYDEVAKLPNQPEMLSYGGPLNRSERVKCKRLS